MFMCLQYIPKLMTPLSRKHLGKDMDIIWTVGTGDHFWNKSQHEPLIITIVLPAAYFEEMLTVFVHFSTKYYYYQL